MATRTKQNTVQQLGMASYEMCVSINLAQRAFTKLLKTCLGHHGLTIPQWTLLGRLYESGPARPIGIAKILGIKPPYIAKLINELEAQSFIISLIFPDDGRGKAIVLTANGKQLVERVEIKLAECLNEQLGNLEEADLQTYFLLTQHIAEHVHHHE